MSSDADATERLFKLDTPVCRGVFQPGVAACFSVGGRCILAPGKRTVSAILRVMGLGQDPQFQRYHRVLNRAVWSSRQASAILLKHDFY